MNAEIRIVVEIGSWDVLLSEDVVTPRRHLLAEAEAKMLQLSPSWRGTMMSFPAARHLASVLRLSLYDEARDTHKMPTLQSRHRGTVS